MKKTLQLKGIIVFSFLQPILRLKKNCSTKHCFIGILNKSYLRQPIENFKFFIIGDLHLFSQITLLALVVQKMDSGINRINRYPVRKTDCTIQWIEIYPIMSDGFALSTF